MISENVKPESGPQLTLLGGRKGSVSRSDGLSQPLNLFGEVVRSISFDQDEIIANILSLHSKDGKIDIDPTYSTGNFYRGRIPQPKLKFDIEPQIKGVLYAKAQELPVKSDSAFTIMFDPPFVVGSHNEGFISGIIKDRFGYYKNMDELWKFYKDSLIEFYRILTKGGIVIFKCQDTVSGGKNYFSSMEIYKMANEVGYYAKDLFIYLSKSRIVPKRDILNQQHARKFHTYFWVFEK